MAEYPQTPSPSTFTPRESCLPARSRTPIAGYVPVRCIERRTRHVGDIARQCFFQHVLSVHTFRQFEPEEHPTRRLIPFHTRRHMFVQRAEHGLRLRGDTAANGRDMFVEETVFDHFVHGRVGSMWRYAGRRLFDLFKFARDFFGCNDVAQTQPRREDFGERAHLDHAFRHA